MSPQILPPEFFGLGGLGQALQQFSALRDQKKQQEKNDRLREFEMIRSVNPDAAARYIGQERAVPAQEFLDNELVRLHKVVAGGGQLSPGDANFYNTRMLGDIDPDTTLKLSRLGVSGEELRQSVARAQLAGIETSNALGELELSRAQRVAQQQQRLDELADQLYPNRAGLGFAGIQDLETFLSDLQQRRAQLGLTNQQILGIRQDIAESQARTARLLTEVEQLTSGLPEDLRPVVQQQAVKLADRAEAPVPMDAIFKYIVNPNDPGVAQYKSVLDAARAAVAEEALDNARIIASNASDEQLRRLSVFASVAEYVGPELLYSAIADVANSAYGPGSVTWTPEKVKLFWNDPAQIRIQDLDQIYSAIQALPAVATEIVGMPDGGIDVEPILQSLIEEAGGNTEVVRTQLLSALESASEPSDRRAVQAMLDRIGGAVPSDGGPGITPASPATPASPGEDDIRTLVRRPEVFNQRVQQLPQNVRARAEIYRRRMVQALTDMESGITDARQMGAAGNRWLAERRRDQARATYERTRLQLQALFDTGGAGF